MQKLYTVSVSTSNLHYCTDYYWNTQFQREVSTEDDVRLSNKSFLQFKHASSRFFANAIHALLIDIVYFSYIKSIAIIRCTKCKEQSRGVLPPSVCIQTKLSRPQFNRVYKLKMKFPPFEHYLLQNRLYLNIIRSSYERYTYFIWTSPGYFDKRID